MFGRLQPRLATDCGNRDVTNPSPYISFESPPNANTLWSLCSSLGWLVRVRPIRRLSAEAVRTTHCQSEGVASLSATYAPVPSPMDGQKKGMSLVPPAADSHVDVGYKAGYEECKKTWTRTLSFIYAGSRSRGQSPGPRRGENTYSLIASEIQLTARAYLDSSCIPKVQGLPHSCASLPSCQCL